MATLERARRVPGQVYVLISSAPWILYWVLSGLAGELGITLAFATSLAILAPKLCTGELNLVDSFTAPYLSLALVGTYTYFKTPIRGLYLVGASTFPGGGVEDAAISGIICASDIAGWRYGDAHTSMGTTSREGLEGSPT